MSAKRPAQYQIDQKTLEPKENDSTPKEQPQLNDLKVQPKQRNIIAVKKDGQNQVKAAQNGTQKKQEQKPVSTGLFSNLFNNNNKPSNGSGLFSNNSSSLFSNNTSAGLFANKPTTGLFTNNGVTSQPKTGGLFSSSSGSTGGSIFNFQQGGVPPIKNTGSSLFGGPAGQQEGGQDQSGDSAQLQAAQNLQVDPSKSTVNYKYEEKCKLVLKQKAFKFKKQGGELIQNVDVVITQDLGSQLYYISIQLPATKKSIYTGLLVKQKSQVKHLNNKKENVEISAFGIVKGKPQQGILKCQFEKQDQGVKVYETVDKIIKGTFSFPVQEKEQKKEVQSGSQKKEQKEQVKKEQKKEQKQQK